MSYRALGKFRCDGCKVIESRDVDVVSDMVAPELAYGWLRVETTAKHGELLVIELRHYCPACLPLIVSYLNGRIMSDGGNA